MLPKTWICRFPFQMPRLLPRRLLAWWERAFRLAPESEDSRNPPFQSSNYTSTWESPGGVLKTSDAQDPTPGSSDFIPSEAPPGVSVLRVSRGHYAMQPSLGTSCSQLPPPHLWKLRLRASTPWAQFLQHISPSRLLGEMTDPCPRPGPRCGSLGC